MALEAPERLDSLLAERAAQPAADRLHVLAGEEAVAIQPNPAPGAAKVLLDALRSRYNFIVADVPFAPVPLYRDLLDLVDQRVLVMEPTLAAVRDTLRLLSLPAGEEQSQRAIVVLNRVGITGGLTRRQVEDALKMKVDVAIPDLPRQVGNAATLGEPAIASSSGFRAGVNEICPPGGVRWAARLGVGSGKQRLCVWRQALVESVPEARMNALPSFGRRTSLPAVPLRPAAPPPQQQQQAQAKPEAPMHLPSAPEKSIIELRNICLARLDPAAVAAMPEDRLTADVERLISEIATERRVQLNAREQRALAGELVDDILGLGPLEPLLEDESISEIMVNGPEKTFIERSGKVVLSNVRFRDTQHLANICQRIAARRGPAHRRIQPDGGCAADATALA